MDVSAVQIPLDPAVGGRGPLEPAGQAAAKASATPTRRGASTELARALAAELSKGPVSDTSELRLRVDDDLKEVIATVVDTETGEVVKSFPPEEVISAAKKLKAMLGQILDRNV
jgi:flagellar protein FlaG